jgi:RecB family exonuclease
VTTGPLRRLSPTRLTDLLACQLRVKHSLAAVFKDETEVHSGPRAGHAALGNVCHDVLHRLVLTDGLANAEAFGPAWTDALAHHSTAQANGELLSLPELPLAKIRLRRAIERIAALVTATPGELKAELDLISDDGRFHGRLDLAVRGPNPWIADLKTGRIRPTPQAPVSPAHIRQLELYAYLEAEATGIWPTHAWLITLQGRDHVVELDPANCRAVVNRAGDTLDSFNRDYPDVPAAPDGENCYWCVHLARCQEPWEADTDWGDSHASLLSVTRVRHGAGAAWVDAEVLAGTVDTSKVSLRRVDLDDHPVARSLKAGDRVVVMGLHWMETADTWHLRRTSRLVRFVPSDLTTP